ncbi:MAG: amidohydrolase family protein [Phycisphaeraceae bacterium]|nr:MAG: amidohydrolase family protein [Phycisphaeraceae bacterium]
MPTHPFPPPRASRAVRHLTRILSIGVVSLSATTACGVTTAQPTGTSPLLPKPESVRDARPTRHAITNATVHVSPTQTLERATVIVKDGLIDRVVTGDADAEALAGSRVWDGSGLHVYAGFIEPFLEVEVPAPDRSAPGVHQNPNVVPQRSALDGVGMDAETRKTLRGLGFTSAAIAPLRGNLRGAAALVSVGDVPTEASADRPPVYRKAIYQAASIKSGEAGFRVYPSSQMGAIALVRQTLLDADHRADQLKRGVSTDPWSCLDALADKSVPLAFDVEHELESLRAAKIGQEFGRPTILIGSGNEYKRLDAIAANGNPTIIPLRFPRTPQVDSISKADEIDLRDLMSWEQHPTNPRRLDEKGLLVALTSSELESRRDFAGNLRKAINHGLKEDRALAMLTTNPAKMLGADAMLGTVEKGKVANLIVADGPIFAKKSKIRDVWVDGVRYEITPETPKGIAGTWDYTFGMGESFDGAIIVEVGDDGKVSVKNEEKADAEGKKSGGERARNVAYRNGVLSYVVDITEGTETSSIVVTATLIGDGIVGRVMIPGVGTMPFTGSRRAGNAETAKTPAQKIAGTWMVTEADGRPVLPDAPDLPRAEITDKGEMTIHIGEARSVATDVVIEEGKISFAYENGPFGEPGIVRDTATISNDEMVGRSIMPDGTVHTWKARKKASDDEEKPAETPDLPGYPFGPFAIREMPAQGNVAITNATVWTSADAGIIENGAVLFSGGKIVYVGPSASMPRFDDSYTVIDATGKHVTPGLIDCHSHTGLFRWGVNEFATNITSECAIGDTTDPDTINWYRQLAGGLVAANQLHGSANPIGGQSQTLKLRWGVRHPDDMHVEDAKPGIKFALGENVKQSNSGQGSTRYPQTRMGVEAILRDRFQQAKEYGEAWTKWNASGGSDKPGTAPRRDLQLEALWEILRGDRLVHCHSYRQDEILMLCRVAKDFGFRIGTFQHVLEGYKVAEAIKEVAIGASAFSDWWNFKVEVQDAIPYNGALMHFAGVNVSFNSDDDQLATHMNIEAAKAVRYGNVPPAEALKFITINPAKQLMIDGRTGSLEVGKDADVVIWSRDPLTATARAEATYVDGREMFSLARDAELQRHAAAERTRLIKKILALDAKPKKPDGESADAQAAGGPPGGGRRRGPRPETMNEYTAGMWGVGSTAGDCGMMQMDALIRYEDGVAGGAR